MGARYGRIRTDRPSASPAVPDGCPAALAGTAFIFDGRVSQLNAGPLAASAPAFFFDGRVSQLNAGLPDRSGRA